MPRDEVMAMTDEELRNKIAQLGGGSLITRTASVKVDDTLTLGEGELRIIPDYPNDISAAGELWGGLGEIRIDGPLVFVWMTGSHAYAPIEGGDVAKAIAKATTRAFILAMEANKT